VRDRANRVAYYVLTLHRSWGTVEMPTYDGEAIPYSIFDPLMINLAMRSSNRREAGNPRIGGEHFSQQRFDLIHLPDQLRPRNAVASREANPDAFAVANVQLPPPSGWREQRLAMADEAHRLPIRLAAPAPPEVEQHQLTAQWSGKRQVEQQPHRRIDYVHQTRLTPEPFRANG
jgi:hypothetical protein